jgi:peptide/nickel transport system permease protein
MRGFHLRSVKAALSLASLGMVMLLLLLATVWTPYDPLDIDLSARLAAPSALHWLGTDEFGRDVFSRALRGLQISCSIATATVLLSVGVGAFLGLLAGFLGRAVDHLLMMVNDALLAFPTIVVALSVLVVVGADARGLVISLSLAYMPAVVRVVRGAVLSLREREYVAASKVAGNSALYTMLGHVLPNAIGPITVVATSLFGWALLSESALSFLGAGIAPPTPTLGSMLASSRPYFDSATWLGVAPGCFIAITLLGVNLFGDALRDRLDPRLRS